MSWNFRRYGAVTDPIHKSHLSDLTGDWGCPKRFKYDRDNESNGGDTEQLTVSGRAAAGTATHETLARALSNPDMSAHLLRGGRITPDKVERVYWEELDREVDGRQARWRDDDNPQAVHKDRVTMITGALNDLHKYVAKVELVEAGFIAPCGPYWLSGHIDLIYRPLRAPDTIATADWKTGAMKPTDLELDHGYEAGVYSTAIHQGYFLPRERIAVTKTPNGQTMARVGKHMVTHPSRYIAERRAMEAALIEVGECLEHGEVIADVVTLGGFPSEVYYVALGDYVPYVKATKRKLTRAEDLRWAGYAAPRQHAFAAGDLRGPAWLPVRITAQDIPRLIARLKNVVGMVRLGRFIDQVGEKCRRCPWADDCLNEGYGPTDAEASAVDRRMRNVPEADTGL